MPDPDKLTFNSAQLYEACSSRDPTRQTQAYETLWQYLYTVALHIVRDQPEAAALAQDCAQVALVRVHERLAECREPAAFRAWGRRIVSHVAIDELRRRKRLAPLGEDNPAEAHDNPASAVLADSRPAVEMTVLADIGQVELRDLLTQAPISDRSRRVVIGRYLDGTPDEELAEVESELTNQPVLPSHIQVTRAKNLTKLRRWEVLRTFLGSRTESRVQNEEENL